MFNFIFSSLARSIPLWPAICQTGKTRPTFTPIPLQRRTRRRLLPDARNVTTFTMLLQQSTIFFHVHRKRRFVTKTHDAAAVVCRTQQRYSVTAVDNDTCRWFQHARNRQRHFLRRQLEQEQ